ncbi:MAG: DUF4474 domain-containing protein [Oscillospiraceae bacterium]|jgi:hypothetical protein|nr:DUF4474 domain-containing protein [Oscillospiraceae bacterium]
MINSVVNTIIAIGLAFMTAFSAPAAQVAKDGKGSVWQFEKIISEFKSDLGWRTWGAQPKGNFKVEMDSTLSAAFAELKKNSGGFDLMKLLAEIPDPFYSYRWLYNANPAKYNAERDKKMAEADRMQAAGKPALDYIKVRLEGVASAMPTGCRFYVKGSDIFMEFSYADGSKKGFDSGVNYNASTGLISQDKVGIAASGFEVNIKKGFVYSSQNPQLQRSLKYHWIYDAVALHAFNWTDVDTVRLQFDYKGKDWMLQLWKGRYFISTGGEVGLYNKNKGLSGWYDCAVEADRIPMSFKLVANDGTVLIDREFQNHWWLTGFAMRTKTYTPKATTLYSTVQPKDEEMKAGLLKALDSQKSTGITYTLSADGKKINIKW